MKVVDLNKRGFWQICFLIYKNLGRIPLAFEGLQSDLTILPANGPTGLTGNLFLRIFLPDWYDSKMAFYYLTQACLYFILPRNNQIYFT